MQPIATERLTVRNFTAEDGPALLKMIVQYQASPYAKYDHPWPTDPEQIKSVAKRFANGDAYLAVCLKETGVFIGFVCLNPEEAETGVVFNIGYIFDFGYHGKGYVTEACRAVLRRAFDELRAEAVVSGTAEANEASCRLLERLGLRVIRLSTTSLQSTPEGKPIEFAGCKYRITREEWQCAL
jgi:ribosomal-protein-alanine N-acetyltransferase